MTDEQMQSIVSAWSAADRQPLSLPAAQRLRIAALGVNILALRPSPTAADLRARIGRDPEDASCVHFALEHLWEVRLRDAGAARALDAMAARIPVRSTEQFLAFRRVVEGRLADVVSGLDDAALDRLFEAYMGGRRLDRIGPAGNLP